MSLPLQHGFQRLIAEFHAKFLYNSGEQRFDIYSQSRLVDQFTYLGVGHYQVFLTRSTYYYMPPIVPQPGETFRVPLHWIQTDKMCAVETIVGESNLVSGVPDGRCFIDIQLSELTITAGDVTAADADDININLWGGWPAKYECHVIVPIPD